MFRKSLLLGIVSGLLAGIVGVAYAKVYYSTNEADFSQVASTVRIIAASLFGGVLAAFGYALLDKWLKGKGEIVFNLIFTAVSFATLLIPIAARLPRTIETPELFPGMVIPMHFFPALAWFTLKPIFIRK
ncbi:MAG TPA: hypothetical protein VNU72_01715 [Puia sp.]|nr:hypothetical protein [Puia sp.]